MTTRYEVVLSFENFGKGRPVMSPIGFGPDTDFIAFGLVRGKPEYVRVLGYTDSTPRNLLLGKGLHKMPNGKSCQSCCICGFVQLLRWESADEECAVDRGHT
jgi:hypothetical protein